MGGLAQFDVSYNPQQDRILLRITNTEGGEYRLWMTRRLSYSVLTELKTNTSIYRLDASDITANPSPLQDESADAIAKIGANTAETVMLADKQQKATAQKENFGVEFKPGESFPLGEEGILIGKVNFQPDTNGAGSHTLSFYPTEGDGISIGVSADFFNSIFEMLERICSQAQWEIVSPSYLQSPDTLQ